MELVTESKIDGTFNGWNGDNYYRLINGQSGNKLTTNTNTITNIDLMQEF